MPADPAVQTLLQPFSDPEQVARYAEGPPRFVPGFADLHRMTEILLAERAPADARVLVVGAGGGLELRALAQSREDWRFVGVDPSAEMLKLAIETLGPLAPRAELIEGYVDDAPGGPFDAATCLLTLHFLDAAERRRTLAEIHRRLKPGAPLVAIHASFPQGAGEREQWLARYAAFAVSHGVEPERAATMRRTVAANLCMLSPEADAAILLEAGFRDVTGFYAAFTWRGWVAYA
ncbi:MAG TPA: class I SAM-dependent methyltransferase [Caulobacteraceae bacterium]|nr:class I SAM-dependent methyltransferase [Caulobacteraceae bacterium]